MILTHENYYSLEANKEFLSVSSLKRFMKCEDEFFAFIDGETKEQATNEAFLIGQYVHTWNEGQQAHKKFIEDNPSIFSSSGKTKGQLKANFKVADQMIKALENDRYCRRFLEGQKEVIIQGEIFGVPFRGMVDSLNLDHKIFSDLKTTQDIHKKFGGLNFIEYYQYDLQMAVYQELLKQQFGEKFMPYIIAVEKQQVPGTAVIRIPQRVLDEKMSDLEIILDRYKKVISGEEEPTSCGRCNYCKQHKKQGVIGMEDL